MRESMCASGSEGKCIWLVEWCISRRELDVAVTIRPVLPQMMRALRRAQMSERQRGRPCKQLEEIVRRALTMAHTGV